MNFVGFVRLSLGPDDGCTGAEVLFVVDCATVDDGAVVGPSAFAHAVVQSASTNARRITAPRNTA